jgi:hypothetical protein
VPESDAKADIASDAKHLGGFSLVDDKDRTIRQWPKLRRLQDAVDPLAKKLDVQPPVVARHEHAAMDRRHDDEVGVGAETIGLGKRAFDYDAEVFAPVGLTDNPDQRLRWQRLQIAMGQQDRDRVVFAGWAIEGRAAGRTPVFFGLLPLAACLRDLRPQPIRRRFEHTICLRHSLNLSSQRLGRAKFLMK